MCKHLQFQITRPVIILQTCIKHYTIGSSKPLLKTFLTPPKSTRIIRRRANSRITKFIINWLDCIPRAVTPLHFKLTFEFGMLATELGSRDYVGNRMSSPASLPGNTNCLLYYWPGAVMF